MQIGCLLENKGIFSGAKPKSGSQLPLTLVRHEHLLGCPSSTSRKCPELLWTDGVHKRKFLSKQAVSARVLESTTKITSPSHRTGLNRISSGSETLPGGESPSPPAQPQSIPGGCCSVGRDLSGTQGERVAQPKAGSTELPFQAGTCSCPQPWGGHTAPRVCISPHTSRFQAETLIWRLNSKDVCAVWLRSKHRWRMAACTQLNHRPCFYLLCHFRSICDMQLALI